MVDIHFPKPSVLLELQAANQNRAHSLFPSMEKYYAQRYRYFSRFDEGIQMDDQGWFSVTPEKIAEHIAQRMARMAEQGVAVDAFCGCGGNAIQLARYFPRVIAVEIDAGRLECARNNARIYGVQDRIDFYHGDFFQICNKVLDGVNVSAIFLSPPWGGPAYIDDQYYSLSSIEPIDGWSLYRSVRPFTPNIVFYLPRNTNLQEVLDLGHDEYDGTSNPMEVEQNFLNGKLKTITVYFGGLAATVDGNR